MILAVAPNPAEVSNDHFTVIVTGIVSIFVAVIGLGVAYVNTTGRRTKRIEEQVANNHTTNLREEADERHDENSRKLDWLVRAVNGIQGDVRNLYSRDQAHDDDIRRISNTIDRRPE